jgi:hypothetical protein
MVIQSIRQLSSGKVFAQAEFERDNPAGPTKKPISVSSKAGAGRNMLSSLESSQKTSRVIPIQVRWSAYRLDHTTSPSKRKLKTRRQAVPKRSSQWNAKIVQMHVWSRALVQLEPVQADELTFA